MPAFGLVMVKVSEVVPFSGIADAPNALLMVGGEATVMLAEAVLPVPPLVEVTLPVVLFLTPLVAPVTVTLNWQLLLVAMVPPVKVMVVRSGGCEYTAAACRLRSSGRHRQS